MATKKSLGSDINFLFEMGSIRFISRTWKRFLNGDFANLAEHHFHVFWIAMMIAAHEKGNIDTGKIAKLALLHDIAESRTGDVDYLSRQYVERHEEMAIQDMLDGTALQKEFLALWHEYETRESIESRIVKDADNLDVDFELAEQASQGFPLKGRLTEIRQFVSREKLFTKTAKQIFDQLELVDPHDWHGKSPRNRRNAGDWKK